MKKKVLMLAMCLGVMSLAMVGCGKGSNEKETTKETASEKETKEKTELKYTIEREDYVGLEVEESKATITDEVLQPYIDSDLAAHYTEIKEGVTEEGMTVDATFSATVDGKEYCKSSTMSFVLDKEKDGKSTDEGFITGLIGKNVGEEFTLNLVVTSTTDANKDYMGKDVVYTVKIEFIHEIPELTDEYVVEEYDYLGISTVDEYKEKYRRTLLVQQLYQVVWPMILENVVIESYDSEEMDSTVNEYVTNLTTNVEQYYKKDLETYLKEDCEGMTKDDLIKYYEDSYKTEVKADLIISHISETEGISISDEEYAKELSYSMEAYGFETEEEFYKYYASYGYDEEYFRDNLLMNKVIEFVIDNIVTVPDKEEETVVE